MTTTPPTWIAGDRAIVGIVLHRRALQVPCIIREVRSNRIQVELVGMPGRFWVRPDDVHLLLVVGATFVRSFASTAGFCATYPQWLSYRYSTISRGRWRVACPVCQ